MDGEGAGADDDDDDDDDDDPDDTRCNDGNGGDDFPLREGIFPAKSPRQEGVSSLSSFCREEAAENFYEVAPR